MNKKTLIICAVFAMISSCKNYGIKDLEQKAKGQVNGFVDKILDPTKDKITSSGSIVDELAKKLQEEEKIKHVEENDKNELMQGDDPNGSVLNLPPVLPASGHANTPVPAVKVAEQNGGQQKEQAKESEAKVEEEKEKEEIEGKKEEQENTKGKKEEKQNKEEQEKSGKEVSKAKEEANAKAEKEKREREAAEQQKRQQEEQQRKVKEEAEKKAKEEQEREEQQKQEEEKKVKDKIKTLTDKIDEINTDVDDINSKTIVGTQEVIDEVTGPVYDDFVDGKNSIRTTWGDLEEESEEEGLGKLLEELSDARDKLRNKLNEGNKPHTGVEKEPDLKENVNVSEISSELTELKSKLEEVKKYLEDKDNFETIKEYIDESNSY
ncbi:ErpC protein [Borreliella carolinensis]|uniref:ErpC protein n=1 Tax=Borreliella carolinensis TaxID=478174 RepID=A0ACD5GM71_9SPIR